MSDKSFFIVAAQSGGGEKAKKFKEIFWKFKKKLESNFLASYSTEITELSFIFRIDGKFSKWNILGCHDLQFNKNKRYFTIDIGITEDVLNKEKEEICSFVLNEFNKGLLMIKERAKKETIQIDFEVIFSQLEDLFPTDKKTIA